MAKRANIYFDDSVRRKLRDIKYVYSTKRNLKTDISYSAIINRLLTNMSIEKIVKILNNSNIKKK